MRDGVKTKMKNEWCYWITTFTFGRNSRSIFEANPFLTNVHVQPIIWCNEPTKKTWNGNFDGGNWNLCSVPVLLWCWTIWWCCCCCWWCCWFWTIGCTTCPLDKICTGTGVCWTTEWFDVNTVPWFVLKKWPGNAAVNAHKSVIKLLSPVCNRRWSAKASRLLNAWPHSLEMANGIQWINAKWKIDSKITSDKMSRGTTTKLNIANDLLPASVLRSRWRFWRCDRSY